MLSKGCHRLFHGLIGREDPFLETIYLPFAGLAILGWPLAVVGAVLASIVGASFLVLLWGGRLSGILFWFGLCYIVAFLAIYDECSNDILDMPEGSYFPKSTRSPSISRRSLFQTSSLSTPMIDLKPLKLGIWLLKQKFFL